MEKVGLRPWCGQPSNRERLKDRTEQNRAPPSEAQITDRTVTTATTNTAAAAAAAATAAYAYGWA